MTSSTKVVEKTAILFAGDSGDGIQLTGFEFSNTAALYGNDLSTFPDFPAEIRAPQGTVSGVSGFKLNFGSTQINTPGGMIDVLVVMNAAALKKNLHQLKPNGLIICNSAGFDKRNLKLAKYSEDANPLEEVESNHKVISIDITKLTRDALKQTALGTKERDRSKNMFVLGFIYWLYHRNLDHTENFIRTKFKSKPEVAEANIMALKAGYNYGITTESAFERFEVKPAKLPKGTYRNIVGNQGTALGFTAAAEKAGLKLFFGSYPITPASDVLHELAKHKNFGVKTFQAEDEIAAIGAAIGASFGGMLGITASSGPGIALKQEAIGLATMIELPLVILNVQRGGPSTGLPTKTEQADLMQAIYGRNGEAPVPVIAIHKPSEAFNLAFTACKIALEHMTPVMLLSDGYVANGAEPWRFPQAAELPKINPPILKSSENYLPYERGENYVRQWAIPGSKGLEHRVGGLEKEDLTGNVSYDPDNHEKMVKLRQAKLDAIANFIPELELDSGSKDDDLLILGWGSTYGAIKVAGQNLRKDGYNVAHAHLTHLNPLPKNLGELLKSYNQVLIPELNNGQLVRIIRDKYLVDAIGLNKIKGLPFLANEIENQVKEMHTAV
ncbi:MAG: 2-oxoacid:acceptor oxidoreductase subunit alpha [Schleiferiaceae bacterium]|nr:2-oxoacid:acceptor oxidoreductase subunit alpha [Schleiferiaceae bacterium]